MLCNSVRAAFMVVLFTLQSSLPSPIHQTIKFWRTWLSEQSELTLLTRESLSALGNRSTFLRTPRSLTVHDISIKKKTPALILDVHVRYVSKVDDGLLSLYPRTLSPRSSARVLLRLGTAHLGQRPPCR